ncbi:MAG: glutamine--fructose-6-phosphate transaminase (isomerizing) [Zetaproteobacteria bacterium]|nr:glutamine--fructose-6-phosphate transaminase (isomerizing) [Pseudobdellovibrionaceae bacterium]|tara:strand:- start:1004 stop:2833 length:1830 start_codon:yes stop_codon:yes gene_type:complete
MCGIYGYIGFDSSSKKIIEGLSKLEYRGYDSAGIALQTGSDIFISKQCGKLSEIQGEFSSLPEKSLSGMGHTRWATHGLANKVNAHPHKSKNFTIVHNGIIENHSTLKKDLIDRGYIFHSETDTEVILHLLEKEFSQCKSVIDAIDNTCLQLVGSFALGIMCIKEPDALFAFKQNSPMVIGVGEDEYFFASDAIAFVEETRHALFLKDGELVRLKNSALDTYYKGKLMPFKKPTLLDPIAYDHGKNGFDHFMLKEIYQQGEVVRTLIKKIFPNIDLGSSKWFESLQLDLSQINQIHIVACGSAYYSGQAVSNFMEKTLNITVCVNLASEFRYREPFLDQGTLVLAISQSGETADTIASVEYAKSYGCKVLSLCNTLHSSLTRSSDATIFLDAGNEIGVASTKAFTAMVFNLYALTVFMGRKLSKISLNEFHNEVKQVNLIPSYIDFLLDKKDVYEDLAKKYSSLKNILYIGRGASYSIALEGSLKLKEISYIHAEAYAGGELKHGPIALVDKDLLIVAIVPSCDQRIKMLSNIEEVSARQGRVLALGSVNDTELRNLCEDYIDCPQVDNPCLQSILSTIPLQLFAYYVSKQKGTDIDQPRNLAKSVTVE